MILEPRTLEELQRSIAAANAGGQRIALVRTEALQRLVEHVPEDMTATVEAGTTLAQFQQHLTARGQWLPVDPPNSDRLTLGGLLSTNASGPRRYGYGTIRDYLIGITVVLADGRLIKAGGKVVKNVAGYDLCKLFVGSHGTLGVIVEATFKLRPLPEAEQFVQAEFDSLAQAEAFLHSVLQSELTPVVMDAHNLLTPHASRSHALTVVLGFAGAREDVEYQMSLAGELGARNPSNLDHETAFWNEGSTIGEANRERPPLPDPLLHPMEEREALGSMTRSRSTGPIRQIAVLPSELARAIQALGNAPFVARAGNGILWHRGELSVPKAVLPEKLTRRVKDAFDPKHIFPDLPL